jgi:hypothetical protein
VVVTRPPEGWFYGLARQYADGYADTLRAMGATLMVVPIDPFLRTMLPGAARTLVDEIRSFRPDLAIGLHDAGYALYCRVQRESHDPLTNLFTDWLGLPTLLIWDHALLQFAPLFIDRLPDRPDESVAGCVNLFRRELSHPLFLHVARDSGHRQVVHDLGILPADRMLLEPAFAHPAFWTGRGEAASGRLAGVAFIGHVRPLRLESRPARCHAVLEDASELALRSTLSDFRRSVQQELSTRLRAMPASLRATLRLDPDESFYWSYLASEVDVFQTRLRTRVIDGLDRSLSLFGDFDVEHPLGKASRRPERFAFGAGAAAAYAGIDVSIDVVNPGFIHGFGTKVMNCFAAGGFMLQDWKKDFVDRFGELGRAISFATIDELRAKVDHFSGHERERRAITAALGETIRTQCSLTHFFARVVGRALQLAE